jgi:predicted small secreted protein
MALVTAALAVSAVIILICNTIPPKGAFQDEKE